MEFQNILWTIEDSVATLTVNRPDKMNALNIKTLQELLHCFSVRANQGDIRVVVLRGAGNKSFVAGADIATMLESSTIQGRSFSDLGHKVMWAMEDLDKPIIAAINGFALGGGLEIAMSCDLIYASDQAKLGLPEVNLGIIPGFGGCQRLPRLIGKNLAKKLIYSGEMIDSETALIYGLIQEIVPHDQLLEKVYKMANKLAQKAPLAIAQAKRTVNTGFNLDLSAATELEKHAFSVLFGTKDCQEGMRAFLEKRKPNFQGR